MENNNQNDINNEVVSDQSEQTTSTTEPVEASTPATESVEETNQQPESTEQPEMVEETEKVEEVENTEEPVSTETVEEENLEPTEEVKAEEAPEVEAQPEENTSTDETVEEPAQQAEETEFTTETAEEPVQQVEETTAATTPTEEINQQVEAAEESAQQAEENAETTETTEEPSQQQEEQTTSTDKPVEEPVQQPEQPKSSSPDDKKKKHKRLAIGLGVGLGVVVLAGAITGIVLGAKSCSSNKDDGGKKLDSNLTITLNYADVDVVSPNATVTWKFYVSYNSLPTTVKKVEAFSSNTSIATVNVPDETKQVIEITGVTEGNTTITIGVTDKDGHYNELATDIYVAGQSVTENDNYIGTVYGRYKIDYPMSQLDINELVPNYNGHITVADVPMSPQILTELHIVNTTGETMSIPNNFLKGCTNLRKLNLSGIKTTSIQNTYLAFPDARNFAVDRLEELAVPEIVEGTEGSEITITDFLNINTGMTSLKKIDFTGFKNVKRIKGWYFCNTCRALDNVDLSPMTSLVEIGVGFMYNCSGITNIKLYDEDKSQGLTNLQVIRNSFMVGCSSLTELDMSGLDNLKVIGAEFLKNCTSLTTLKFPGDSTNQNAIQSIGHDTENNEWKVIGQFLYGCTSLQKLDFSPLNNNNFAANTQITGVDAEFRNKPYKTIYAAYYDFGVEGQALMCFGCTSLTEVDFGTLTTIFGPSSTLGSGNVDGTSFYTKAFATEDEANAYIAGSDGMTWTNGTSLKSYTIFQNSSAAKKVGDQWCVRKWKA